MSEMQIKKLTERIAYIKATRQPLSADVGIVQGDEFVYIFDVGNSIEVVEYLQMLEKKKRILLSHFHPDHIGNLSRLSYETVYMGTNTAKYVVKQLGKAAIEDIPGCQTIQEKNRKYINLTDGGSTQSSERDFYRIWDGVEFCITSIPSSHAKGCLALTIDNMYTFLGDATYCTVKQGVPVYNAQLLKEQIEVLSAIETTYFLLSHAEPFVQKKEMVLKQLWEIYKKRKKDVPYIEV